MTAVDNSLEESLDCAIGFQRLISSDCATGFQRLISYFQILRYVYSNAFEGDVVQPCVPNPVRGRRLLQPHFNIDTSCNCMCLPPLFPVTISHLKAIITIGDLLFRRAKLSTGIMEQPPSIEVIFSHEKLDEKSTSCPFRLLRILPAANLAEEIRCEIFHSSLDDHPKYEAPSYTWGDPNVTEPISVEGKICHITTNPNCARRYIRFKDRERVL